MFLYIDTIKLPSQRYINIFKSSIYLQIFQYIFDLFHYQIKYNKKLVSNIEILLTNLMYLNYLLLII